MYIGTTIFLIAIGAILRFAVTALLASIDLQTAGVILMVVGAIALLISLLLMAGWADRRGRRTVPDDDAMRDQRYRY